MHSRALFASLYQIDIRRCSKKQRGTYFSANYWWHQITVIMMRNFKKGVCLTRFANSISQVCVSFAHQGCLKELPTLPPSSSCYRKLILSLRDCAKMFCIMLLKMINLKLCEYVSLTLHGNKRQWNSNNPSLTFKDTSQSICLRSWKSLIGGKWR